MANMSYCRFQNTLNDLRDCYNEMTEHSGQNALLESLSNEEKRAAKQMIELCNNIICEYGEDDEDYLDGDGDDD